MRTDATTRLEATACSRRDLTREMRIAECAELVAFGSLVVDQEKGTGHPAPSTAPPRPLD
jgi:hypothetical protein